MTHKQDYEIRKKMREEETIVTDFILERIIKEFLIKLYSNDGSCVSMRKLLTMHCL
jgi:hypothetical protein